MTNCLLASACWLPFGAALRFQANIDSHKAEVEKLKAAEEQNETKT
jgi:hypothetical protein